MPVSFITEPLNASHNRERFSCGEKSLDIYLQQYASQDQKRKEAAIFATINETRDVKGYYTLSALHVQVDDFPQEVLKKLRLSSYPNKPATLLGRLAVDRRFQCQKLGSLLLIDSMKRTHYQSEQIGSLAMVVDALHEKAAEFYRKFGFASMPSNSLRLLLPMKTIGKLYL